MGPRLLLFWYLGFSVLTFIITGVDKHAARRGWWRVRESTLHTLALAGGWPGVILAVRCFRHKTRKKRFLTVLGLISLVHVLIWIVLVVAVTR